MVNFNFTTSIHDSTNLTDTCISPNRTSSTYLNGHFPNIGYDYGTSMSTSTTSIDYYALLNTTGTAITYVNSEKEYIYRALNNQYEDYLQILNKKLMNEPIQSEKNYYMDSLFTIEIHKNDSIIKIESARIVVDDLDFPSENKIKTAPPNFGPVQLKLF